MDLILYLGSVPYSHQAESRAWAPWEPQTLTDPIYGSGLGQDLDVVGFAIPEQKRWGGVDPLCLLASQMRQLGKLQARLIANPVSKTKVASTY